ncbi:hypothetical protein DY000_02052202 [Brassica cretica]|uniref:DUF4005 domain-containing protein n=1 Tax=Brassica cretica TaxID=69181 RepID=A0ABQ7AJ08_BRACR|nr:hypothetical protein DY000_02052202 [Brassica cretica]
MIRSVLEISDDFGAFWRYLEQAPEMTIELDPDLKPKSSPFYKIIPDEFYPRYMPRSTRSNNKTQLLFSPDPASLERSIRKEARSSSTDNTTCVSLDSAQPPSTQTLKSIDTEPRDMVAPLILVRNNNGDLHDQEGHLHNAAGQRIDAQRAAIPEPDANATGTTLLVDEAAQPRTLADYNRPDRYYTNRSAIRPPTIERDFELKAQAATALCSKDKREEKKKTNTDFHRNRRQRSHPSIVESHLLSEFRCLPVEELSSKSSSSAIAGPSTLSLSLLL